MARFSALVVLALLAGCATPDTSNSKLNMWEPDRSWWALAIEGRAILENADKKQVLLPPGTVRALFSARQRVEAFASADFDLGILDSPLLNAYALAQGSRPKIIVSLGLISALKEDADAFTFVLAHELAHHALGHVASKERTQRNSAFKTQGIVFGNIANLFVPFSGIVVSQAFQEVGRAYSRDEERSADEQAIQWMRTNRINLCGAARVMAELQKHSDGGGFFSTHPGGKERLERIDEQALLQSGARCRNGQ